MVLQKKCHNINCWIKNEKRIPVSNKNIKKLYMIKLEAINSHFRFIFYSSSCYLNQKWNKHPMRKSLTNSQKKNWPCQRSSTLYLWKPPPTWSWMPPLAIHCKVNKTIFLDALDFPVSSNFFEWYNVNWISTGLGNLGADPNPPNRESYVSESCERKNTSIIDYTFQKCKS